ncbi:hypothetical protein AB0E12_29890 [Micromonospora chersina]|uniref:hypothetical protein n=1 Tax=Micromonospora chersina TaxID=47854 RepID=UPI0033FF71B8
MAWPFPSPYPTLLGDDPALGLALDGALAETLAAFPGIQLPYRTAISIVAIDETISPPDFRHAGLRYGETFYSASLLKVAAMYGAYELHSRASEVAAQVSTAAEFFARIRAEFDSKIDAAVPAISLSPDLTPAMRRPKYEQIFTTLPLPDGGLALEFRGDFETQLKQMIINGRNDAAAACVTALGYGWINATLHAGGFFFPPAQSGIWLAGTFVGAMPAVRVPSVNDGPVAQATTCFDMANLYAHIFQGTLVNNDSSRNMLAMLATGAAVGDEPSYMDYTRRRVPPRQFTVTHTKIGRGPLKTGEIVLSDGSIVERPASGHRFIVVWQNTFSDDTSLAAIGFLVERTIERFLSP